MYIDSHTHLYLPQFDDDRKEVISRALDAGISRMYLPNIDQSTYQAMMSMVGSYPRHCFPMIGLHPCSVKADYEDELKFVEAELASGIYAAVGEIGTDLYWDKEFKGQQIDAFRREIGWALQYELPIVIHSRETLALNIQIVSELQNGNLTGVFHCFNGTIEQAQQITDLGFYMGLGGVVTFKNAGLDDVVRYIPMDRILLETDAPYLTPAPFRGKRNESSYIPLVADRIATIKDLAIEEIAEATTDNARALFDK